jgi:hypothetical protein
MISTTNNNNLQQNRESQIQLALQALKQDANLTPNRAAALYSVSRKTLTRRLNGTPARRDWTPKSMKLTLNKEKVILEHILNLNTRGFPPRLPDVRDMADSLLVERGGDPVGER